MDINFELYKIFYHAADSGSFSKAAERLHITQSAVSQSIRNLEERTGQILFSRKARKISLTAEGAVLFKHIEQAYNFIKAGENRLNELKNLESGIIRLGAGDTVCKYFLVPILEKFIKIYPNVKLNVINRTSSQLIALLKGGLLDLCIVTLPVDDPDVDVHGFRQVEDVFIASTRFKELRGRDVSLAELCGYPLMLLQDASRTRKNLDSFLSARSIHVKPEIELESIDLLVDFARIGLGVSHVLKESALASINKGDLFIVKTIEKLPKRKLGTAIVKNVPLPHAAAVLAKMLETVHDS